MHEISQPSVVEIASFRVLRKRIQMNIPPFFVMTNTRIIDEMELTDK